MISTPVKTISLFPIDDVVCLEVRGQISKEQLYLIFIYELEVLNILTLLAYIADGIKLVENSTVELMVILSVKIGTQTQIPTYFLSSHPTRRNMIFADSSL